MWQHKTLYLPPYSRGFHLITDEVLGAMTELKQIQLGICHLFLQHTSASLTINENADPTVRHDLEKHLNEMVPEGKAYYLHTYEGADDMPAHIKASLLGSSLTIPVTDGTLQLGTWQGIYLGEHRNDGGRRKLVIRLNGE